MALPKCLRFFILIFGLSQNINSQEIPLNRITDWSFPGSRTKIDIQRSLNLVLFGADNTGKIASDQALQLALNSLNGPGEIFFPKGRYLFKQTINLPDSTILRGELDSFSTNSLTLLILSPGNNRHGIAISGGELNVKNPIEYGPKQGDQKIKVPDITIYKAGEVIKLSPTDDSLLVNNSWAYHSTGQIFEILKIEGDSLVLSKPLRRTYSASKTPFIIKLNPRRQAHILCLNLLRGDTTTSQSSNIYFNYSLDCSASGLQSTYCNFAHIDINNSSRISIENSYFKDAHSYGGGGKAYGVMLQSGSGDCYVHQNYFEHLRHSMILQSGANGNVLAYNYSFNPFWTETVLPANSAGDLVLHGNYVYMNLFEANVIQNIVIDNSHGRNGPYNTFFRNRAELYGIFMNAQPASDSQNFIANQVTNTTSPFLGLYSLQGIQHFELGNMIKGSIVPSSTSEPVLTTLFNYTFSSYYKSISTIPPIRVSNWKNTTPFIEVTYRIKVFDKKSICEEMDYTTTGVENQLNDSLKNIHIVPNPFQEIIRVQISSDLSGRMLEIFNSTGKLMYREMMQNSSVQITTQKWQPGYYFARLHGLPVSQSKLLKI